MGNGLHQLDKRFNLQNGSKISSQICRPVSIVSKLYITVQEYIIDSM
jgi:hypothetical protein